jgi:hypothetical protein
VNSCRSCMRSRINHRQRNLCLHTGEWALMGLVENFAGTKGHSSSSAFDATRHHRPGRAGRQWKRMLDLLDSRGEGVDVV